MQAIPTQIRPTKPYQLMCWNHSFPVKKCGQFNAEYMNKSEELCSAFSPGPTSSSIFPPGGQEKTEDDDRSLLADYTVGKKKKKEVFLTIWVVVLKNWFFTYCRAGNSMMLLRGVQLRPVKEYFQGKGSDIQRQQNEKEQLINNLKNFPWKQIKIQIISDETQTTSFLLVIFHVINSQCSTSAFYNCLLPAWNLLPFFHSDWEICPFCMRALACGSCLGRINKRPFSSKNWMSLCEASYSDTRSPSHPFLPLYSESWSQPSPSQHHMLPPATQELFQSHCFPAGFLPHAHTLAVVILTCNSCTTTSELDCNCLNRWFRSEKKNNSFLLFIARPILVPSENCCRKDMVSTFRFVHKNIVGSRISLPEETLLLIDISLLTAIFSELTATEYNSI